MAKRKRKTRSRSTPKRGLKQLNSVLSQINVIAPERLGNKAKDAASKFLSSMRDGDYDYVWNNLITVDGIKFLSSVLLPTHISKTDDIEKLFTPLNYAKKATSIMKAVALIFQLDIEDMRSAFFKAIADGFYNMGWYDFSIDDSYAFLDGTNILLVGDTSNISLMLPLIQDFDGDYKIDFEVLTIFSMSVSASMLYEIGRKALEIDEIPSAVAYFELCASLAKPHQRLRRLILDNLIVQELVTPLRKQELQEQENYVILARDQVLKLLSTSDESSIPVDISSFMISTFKGYDKIPNTDISSEEINYLHSMNDSALRNAIATILVNVDPVAAQREAEKPHGPAEIADMELPIVFGNELYYLCMPFKSGREVKLESVPVDVSYQIIRPFMYFPRCIVIFITSKPCSQYLLNYIKISGATQGWPIGIIQHKELGKLLKINGLLTPS